MTVLFVIQFTGTFGQHFGNTDISTQRFSARTCTNHV